VWKEVFQLFGAMQGVGAQVIGKLLNFGFLRA